MKCRKSTIAMKGNLSTACSTQHQSYHMNPPTGLGMAPITSLFHGPHLRRPPIVNFIRLCGLGVPNMLAHKAFVKHCTPCRSHESSILQSHFWKNVAHRSTGTRTSGRTSNDTATEIHEAGEAHTAGPRESCELRQWE